MFVPSFFKRGPSSGLIAARALHAKLLKNFPTGVKHDKLVIQVTIILNAERKQDLIFDMLAEGVIRAPGDLDAFASPACPASTSFISPS